jgi:hypothetical protein
MYPPARASSPQAPSQGTAGQLACDLAWHTRCVAAWFVQLSRASHDAEVWADDQQTRYSGHFVDEFVIRTDERGIKLGMEQPFSPA